MLTEDDIAFFSCINFDRTYNPTFFLDLFLYNTAVWTALKSFIEFADVHRQPECKFYCFTEFYAYNIEKGCWAYHVEDDSRMETNFCLVKKQAILPSKHDGPGQEESEALVERYFEQLSKQTEEKDISWIK